MGAMLRQLRQSEMTFTVPLLTAGRQLLVFLCGWTAHFACCLSGGVKMRVWRPEACLLETKLFWNVQMGSHRLPTPCLLVPNSTPGLWKLSLYRDLRLPSIIFSDGVLRALCSGRSPQNSKDKEEKQRKRHEPAESWEGHCSTASCGL